MAETQVIFSRLGAKFTVDLFQQLGAASGFKENVIFSPFSIQTCVALAYEGAEGDTAKEIVDGMKFHSNNLAQSFEIVLKKYLNSDLVKVANKIYVQEGATLKKSYADVLQKYYHTQAEHIQFGANKQAADHINKWVESKTNYKIKDIISHDALNEDTRLVLINAIHFKGQWEQKFETLEEPSDFWISENESIQADFMMRKAKFGYGKFNGFTALEMPYKESDLSMLVLLPDERAGLTTLCESLKDLSLIDLSNNITTDLNVIVQMPKFKVEYSVELSNVFKKLGMQKMFSDSAEFGNMLESGTSLTVSQVVHKAFIEVNEEGTEAAAATGIIMMTRAFIPEHYFNADHPFIYMIWDKKNILFAGAFVNTPSPA